MIRIKEEFCFNMSFKFQNSNNGINFQLFNVISNKIKLLICFDV